jgi:hypothetical protein
MPVDPHFLSGELDLGLGFCLQCVAEYKMGGEQQEQFPNFAVMLAPIAMPGMPPGVVGSCYKHLIVRTPSQLQQAVPRLDRIPVNGPAMPLQRPGPRHSR